MEFSCHRRHLGRMRRFCSDTGILDLVSVDQASRFRAIVQGRVFMDRLLAVTMVYLIGRLLQTVH